LKWKSFEKAMKIPKSQSSASRWLILCCQGIVVGTASILPGLSGGAFCMAFGIYEPMMAILAHPVHNFKRYYKMLLPFLIGCIGGFLLLARGAALLFEMSPEVVMALLAGLIFGTMPKLIKKSHDKNSSQSWSSFIISMIIVFALLSFLRTGTISSVTPTALWYLFCGMVWGLSVVLPGLNFFSLLIFLCLYQPLVAGIAALDIAVIIPWLFGLLITVLLCVRLIYGLLERRYGLISKIVLGMMISSTLMILPTAFTSVFSVFLSIVCLGAGFAIAGWIDNAEAKSSTAD
jgi:putative membrane protein